MKITKNTLKQLIKEEFAALQEEPMSIPGEEGGRQLEVPELGRWRLGPAIVQLGFAYTDRRNSTLAQMNELDNRYTRTV